ncbi:unnamed protein product, partial [Callosobruchus maculatus]
MVLNSMYSILSNILFKSASLISDYLAYALLTELPALPGDLEMEVATNVALARGLPPAPQVKPPTKKEAKLLQQRLEKFARLNTHLPALFDAVQHGHMEKARTILESTDVDVNR